jgi:hypothetical protein
VYTIRAVSSRIGTFSVECANWAQIGGHLGHLCEDYDTVKVYETHSGKRLLKYSKFGVTK